MKCKFTFKGYTFNSEAELDDFLIAKYPHYKKYGDQVFQRKAEQLRSIDILDKFSQETEQYKKEFEEARRKRKYLDDTDADIFEIPHMGVNAFIAQAKDPETGKMFTPEFRDKPYWNGRIANWTSDLKPEENGDWSKRFSEDEINMFFEGDTFEERKKNARKLTNEEAKILKNIMLQKWKYQSTTGTGLHFVMQQYLRQIKKDGKLINVSDLSHDELIEFMNKQMETELKDQMGRDYRIVETRILEQMINYAAKFKEYLIKTHGENAIFYTEYSISGRVNKINPNDPEILMGTIDLLVVDEDGHTHIYDYKASPKPYSKFDSAKRRAFQHQLAVYAKILQQQGLSYKNSMFRIVPLQLENLRLVNQDEAKLNPENAKFEFDNIKHPDELVKDIKADIFYVTPTGKHSIMSHLDDYFPEAPIQTATSSEIIKSTRETASKIWQDYKGKQLITEEEIAEELKNSDSVKKLEGGDIEYSPEGSYAKPIRAKSEEELVKKVLNQRLRYDKLESFMTQTLQEAIQYGIDNNTSNIDEFLRSIDTKRLDAESDSILWFKQMAKNYCSSDFEVVTQPGMIELGMILIKNKITNKIDIIRLSPYYLDYNRKFGGRQLLSGCHIADIIEQSKGKNMLAGTTGNMQLIESLLYLRNYKGLFEGDFKQNAIGNVQIMNPFSGKGTSVTNEKLLYTYKQLFKYAKISEQDAILDGTIKFLDVVDNARTDLHYLLKTINDNHRLFKPEDYEPVLAEWDEVLGSDIETKKSIILRAISKLEQNYPQFKTQNMEGFSQDQSKAFTLYNELLRAYGALSNLDYSQQLKQSDKYYNSLNPFTILKEGFGGLYTDNPGNLTSDILNTMYKAVSMAYQNIRQRMMTPVAKLRTLTENLKKVKGYNPITRQVVNPTSMYKNMITIAADGDMLFTNPNNSNLLKEEKEFLKYTMRLINKNRFPRKTDKELDEMEKTGDLSYYRIPLTQGSTESKLYNSDLSKVFLERCKKLTDIKNIKENTLEYIQKSMDKEYRTYDKSAQLYEMTTRFDRSEVSGSATLEERLNYIQDMGTEFFEQNLQVLALEHTFAYMMKEQVSEVLPVIKSAKAELLLQGKAQNKNFKKDLEYYTDYFKAKIKNESLEQGEGMKGVTVFASKFKSLASFLALAFSPVQFTYQSFQGLLVDSTLIATKIDGTRAFTIKNFMDAARIVYQDLFHYSDKPTKCQLLNELFGMNDMDMNTYSEKLRSDKHGIYNIWNLAFKFCSRPDYYNRMVILVARMKNDGIWDAIEIEDGQLKYNWKKDKRYNLYANKTNPNSEEYKKQQALYLANAKQFVQEGAINPDGSSFKVGDPLPVPYTSLEIESIKSLCNTMYGYYSHEQKSLIHNTFLGALYMQMKTFWSGKKNQYLQQGGVKLQGKWAEAVDEITGEKLYYKINENGTISDDITTENTGVPVIQWKGQWQEGVLLSIANLFKNDEGKFQFDTKGVAQGIKLLNPFVSKTKYMEELGLKEEMAEIYKANVVKFWADLAIAIFFGGVIAGFLLDWSKFLAKESKKSDSFLLALGAAGANYAYLTVRNSSADMNWAATVGSPMLNWGAFSFDSGMRTAKSISNLITTDQSLYKTLTNISTAGRQARPLFDYLDPNKE